MNAIQQSALETLQASVQSFDSEFRIEAGIDGVHIGSASTGLEFRHSFVSGPLARRARQANQALLKACNNKQRNILNLLDLTAGWGGDGLTLAQHGQNITLLEHNPLVYACIVYSLAQLEANNANTAKHMTIEQANAFDYLQGLPDDHNFDCIYLDPMFPAHKSSAKPAKDMQILQALTDNLQIETCFELALQKARRRVVVKRPAKATHLSELKPDFSYREKTIRFDVFLAS